MKISNPGKAYKTLKQLEARAGDNIDSLDFQLPEHEELTNAEAAEDIAEYFSKISQEYPPINLESLPHNVASAITNAKPSEVPHISEDMVENIAIFNSVAKTGIWPKRWKSEEAIPLKKVAVPLMKEELRIISKTPLLSTEFERLVMI